MHGFSIWGLGLGNSTNGIEWNVVCVRLHLTKSQKLQVKFENRKLKTPRMCDAGRGGRPDGGHGGKGGDVILQASRK